MFYLPFSDPKNCFIKSIFIEAIFVTKSYNHLREYDIGFQPLLVKAPGQYTSG